jgi:hypothetical protein
MVFMGRTSIDTINTEKFILVLAIKSNKITVK